MRTDIPEKLLVISDDIAAHGNVPLTRLTVLKRWFEQPQRLTTFAVWVAARASSRKGKSTGVAADLFRAARDLLAGAEYYHPQLDRAATQALVEELRAFQNEYQNQQWGPVRVIQNWNLFLVESGLETYLGHDATPARGYKLAADYCQHYDSRYGNGLNGPSATKLREIVRFMFTIEEAEDPVGGESRNVSARPGPAWIPGRKPDTSRRQRGGKISTETAQRP